MQIVSELMQVTQAELNRTFDTGSALAIAPSTDTIQNLLNSAPTLPLKGVDPTQARVVVADGQSCFVPSLASQDTIKRAAIELVVEFQRAFDACGVKETLQFNRALAAYRADAE